MRFVIGWSSSLRVVVPHLVAGFAWAGSVSVVWAGDCQWQALGAGVNGVVLGVGTYQGDIIMTGDFTMAGSVAALNIARWEESTGTWHALGSGLNARGFALIEHNGDLIAAGDFNSAGGVVVDHIARWDGSQWHAIAGGDTLFHTARQLVIHDGQVVTNGTNHYCGGLACGIQSRVNALAGGAWAPIGGGFSQDVNTLAVYQGELLAGGHFAQFCVGYACLPACANPPCTWTPINFLARRVGGQWEQFGGGANGSVNDLLVIGVSCTPAATSRRSAA